MKRVGNEEGIPRESVLLGNVIEHVMGFTEEMVFGVKGDELGSKEIVKNCGAEDEPGVELLGLADKLVVGAMLNEVAVECVVDRVAGNKYRKGLAGAAVDGGCGLHLHMKPQCLCEHHSENFTSNNNAGNMVVLAI